MPASSAPYCCPKASRSPPPAGAAADKPTVQLELPPDTTLVGEHARLVTFTVEGVTVTEAVAEPPFSAAVTVTA